MRRMVLLVALVGLAAEGEGCPGLAERLASTDGDVEAANLAYEAGEFEEANARLDAAESRLGDRPELSYDRGLIRLATGDVEGARKSFEHGTESGEIDIRASSHYELGNLSFDAEDYEAAIASYREALRAAPGHENAKWNLEVALERRRQQEEEQEKEEQENEENEDEEQENEEQENEENEDEEQEPGEDDQGEEEQEEPQGESGEEEQPEEEEPGEEEEQDEEQAEQEEPPEPEEKQAQRIDQADIDAALEELDAQDDFALGNPSRRVVPVDKDW